MSKFKPVMRNPLRSFARLFSPRRRAPDRDLDRFVSQMECDIWEDYDRDPEEDIERQLDRDRASA